MSKFYEELPLYDRLKNKIDAYYQTIWREKWKGETDQVVEWMSNFLNEDKDIEEQERVNMLYLLSKFMYFGNSELRELLISLYRDLFKYPIISSIRKENNNTTDLSFINEEFRKELQSTRFLGVGNPSESGVHMLYYFRQECNLSKEYFLDKGEIFFMSHVKEKLPDGTVRSFLNTEIKNTAIKRYVFIDDFCGSGTQVKDYLQNIVANLKFKKPDVEVLYLMLFTTETGLSNVKALNIFDRVEAVFIIDESFKAFSEKSRYFVNSPDAIIDREFAKSIAKKYGENLFHPNSSLGYGDCQLLLGLYHNTPDNSLPIFWSTIVPWKPIFKRYHKLY